MTFFPVGPIRFHRAFFLWCILRHQPDAQQKAAAEGEAQRGCFPAGVGVRQGVQREWWIPAAEEICLLPDHGLHGGPVGRVPAGSGIQAENIASQAFIMPPPAGLPTLGEWG